MASRSGNGKKNTMNRRKKPVRREVWGIVCLVLGLFSLIGFKINDYWLIDGLCLYVFKGLLGWGYFIVPAVLIFGAIILINHKGRPVTARLVCLFCMPLLLGAILHLFLCEGDYGFDWFSIKSLYLGGINLETGGVLSGILSNFLRKAVSTWGAAPLLFLGFVALGFVAARISLRDTVDDFKNRKASPYVPVQEVARQKKTRRRKDELNPEPMPARPLPQSEIFSINGQTEFSDDFGTVPQEIIYSQGNDTISNDRAGSANFNFQSQPQVNTIDVEAPESNKKLFGNASRKRTKKTSVMDKPLEEAILVPTEDVATQEDIPAMPRGPIYVDRNTPQYVQMRNKQQDEIRNAPTEPLSRKGTETSADSADDFISIFQPHDQNSPEEWSEDSNSDDYVDKEPIDNPLDRDGIESFEDHFGAASTTAAATRPSVTKKTPAGERHAAEKHLEPVSKKDVEKAYHATAKEIEKAQQNLEGGKDYLFPPLNLLKSGKPMAADGRSEMEANRARLEGALHSFGIGAAVRDITRGPSVTRYDLELEAGVKLNKITNLANDIALAMGVANVRIAPIPDKISTVGVEVPNKTVSTVFLRDILASDSFQKASSKLSFGIGKDIAGNNIVGNISKLPHMLIAGTTGSGKSVCMNSLILSLLFKSTPEEVRLIMIDPKMVELGIYNGIPHLYIPVVTDPKKAAGSLQWAVVEMLKRYQRFSDIGVRDLAGYNKYKREHGDETMPNVVIVIDELADLMMTAAKEVEESICRVAQMGRAAGMHLVIATQRPSADVITGLMKANIPSRIAFAVSSSLESRIILDQQGAEKLIGYGDMLYNPLGAGKPLRVQGAFVSDEERENVINFIKEGGTAHYDSSILDAIEKAVSSNKDKDGDNGRGGSDRSEEMDDPNNPFAGCDELLPDAVEAILDTKQASVSMLQRKLKLGYSRAARIIDQMEELGIVGPFEGSKPRQILISRESWQEYLMNRGQTATEQLMQESKDDFSRD